MKFFKALTLSKWCLTKPAAFVKYAWPLLPPGLKGLTLLREKTKEEKFWCTTKFAHWQNSIKPIPASAANL